jgi:hypothetical protein
LFLCMECSPIWEVAEVEVIIAMLCYEATPSVMVNDAGQYLLCLRDTNIYLNVFLCLENYCITFTAHREELLAVKH